MKARTKTNLYLLLGILGLAFVTAAMLLSEFLLTDSQSSALIGVGAGLFGFGIAKWLTGRWCEKIRNL